MLVLSLLLAIALLVAAVRYPPFVAAAFILLAMSDTAGLGGLFAGTPLSYVLGPLCFMGTVVAYGKLLRERRRDPSSRRALTLATLALFGSCWLGLAAYAVNGNLRDVFNNLFSSGMYGMVIALAYYRERRAQLTFVALVALQLGVSTVMILHPGANSLMMARQTLLADDGSGVSTLESLTRVSAQFGNPVQLAFYAKIGIALGIMFLIGRRWPQRACGLALVLMGLLITFNTIERAIMLGFALALVIAAVRSPLTLHARMSWLFWGFAAAVACVVLLQQVTLDLSFLPPAALQAADFFARLGESSEYQYRVDAFNGSLNLVWAHPLLGVGTFEELMRVLGLAPHQAILYWSVIGGLPAGLVCTLMLWFGVAATGASRARLLAGLRYEDVMLYLIFGWVIVAMAMSNGMSAGMFGWVCLAIASLAWVQLPQPARAPVAVQPLRQPASPQWPLAGG